jgi:hypothetical protein
MQQLLTFDTALGRFREATTSATAAMRQYAVPAASANGALPTLGSSRGLHVMADTLCFFRSGDANVVALAADSHPLAADERFQLRVPAGHTHIAVVRDSADGFISVVPVP